MSERKPIPQVGRAIAWTKNTPEGKIIIGAKIYLFKEGTTQLDFDGLGVLVTKRDLQDLLDGRIRAAPVLEDQKIQRVEQPVKVPKTR